MNGSLSDLRARAFTGERYWWIHVLAIAYMILVGSFAAMAWAADGEYFRAAMCAGAQVLAVVCAILARRALTAEMMWTGGAAAIAGGMCALWAAKGIEHAWTLNGEAIETWQVWFLAALEPGLFLLAEHVQEVRAERRAKAAQDAADEAAELARIRAKQDRRDEEESAARLAAISGGQVADIDAERERRPARRRTAAAVTGAALALAAGHAGATELVAQPHAGADAQVARAMSLKDRMSRAEVASELGVSERTVTRLWKRGAEANASALALAG